MNSPEARLSYRHTLPRYVLRDGAYTAEVTTGSIESPNSPLGQSFPIEAELPAGFIGTHRKALLLNGAVVDTHSFYAENPESYSSPESFETSRAAIIAAFAWVLEAVEFPDEEVATNEGRAERIGDIFGIAVGYGLTEKQARICYNTAYIVCKQALN